jgi:hypothetical protein
VPRNARALQTDLQLRDRAAIGIVLLASIPGRDQTSKTEEAHL